MSLAALTLQPASPVAAAPSTTPLDSWVTDGRVADVELVGGRIILGGRFNRIGPNVGHFGTVDPRSGALAGPAVKVNGNVLAVAPDGNGGWFIGGAFTGVDGVSRNNGAQILADGRLGAWNPLTNGAIRAMEVSSGTVYIGGDFTTVKGKPRQRLAALDASTGAVSNSWMPSVDAPVHALGVSGDGSRLFVGGEFSLVNGRPRNRLAALDTTTGTADLGFTAVANDVVRSIAVSPDGQTVYLGGSFSLLGAALRSRLAAVDPAIGLVLPWNPGADGVVNGLAVSPDSARVYVGGGFTRLGGVARARAGAVGADGATVAWAPNPNAPVHSLAVSSDGASVYLGGAFTHLRKTVAEYAGLVDAKTGVPDTSFNPRGNRPVRSVAVAGAGVALGGEFTSLGAVSRKNLAALDASTLRLDPTWNPPAPADEVTDMALSPDGSTLYVVGLFTSVGGQARLRGAAYRAHSAALTAWDPAADGPIHAVATKGDWVYVGGSFQRLRGVPVLRLGRVDPTSAALDPLFAPTPDQNVYMLDAPPGPWLYAGGLFTVIGGRLIQHLARFDAAGAIDASWAPNPAQLVIAGALSNDGTSFYAGVGGSGDGGNSVQKVSAVDGATLWRTQVSGDVQAVAVSPDDATVYAGGHFGSVLVGGIRRTSLLALNAVDGTLTSWAPNPDLSVATGNSGVWGLVATPTSLIAAGDFRAVGLTSSGSFAMFPGAP